MTLEDIAKQIGEMRGEFGGLRGELADLKRTVTEGFDASKTRDEELRDLMKFSLEAREALRETVNDRFDQTDRKFDDQILLLKDVIKHNVTK
jgi:septation ring formation regulator EzrA